MTEKLGDGVLKPTRGVAPGDARVGEHVDAEGIKVANGGEDGNIGEVLLEDGGQQLHVVDVVGPRLFPHVMGRVVLSQQDVI